MCTICHQYPHHPLCAMYQETYTCAHCLNEVDNDEACQMGGKFYCHECADEVREQLEDDIAYLESQRQSRIAELRFCEGFIEENAGDDEMIAKTNRRISELKQEIK